MKIFLVCENMTDGEKNILHCTFSYENAIAYIENLIETEYAYQSFERLGDSDVYVDSYYDEIYIESNILSTEDITGFIKQYIAENGIKDLYIVDFIIAAINNDPVALDAIKDILKI